MSLIHFGTRANTGEEYTLSVSQFAKTHFHVLGATQVGKTHFLERIARDIIKAGYGFLCLDGKGELYEKLLKFLCFLHYPAHKLYLIDPRDDYSVGVNVLDRLGKTDAVTQANLVIEALQKMHGDHEVRQLLDEWGRAILIPLIEAGLSITEIFPFTTDKHFRSTVLSHVSDSFILKKWNEYDSYSPTRQAQLTSVVKRRLEIFRLSPFLCGMFGQLTTTLNWHTILTKQQIVLGQLAHGVDDKALSFMGASLIHQLKRVCYGRTKASPYFFVILDEFQRFLTPDIETALAQLSGLHISFHLAHQNMEQLRAESSPIYHAVRNNCRAKAVFACSDYDAGIMARDGLGDKDEIRKQKDRHFHLKIKHHSALQLITPTVKDTPVSPRQLAHYKQKVYNLTSNRIDQIRQEVEQRAHLYVSYTPQADIILSTLSMVQNTPRGKSKETHVTNIPIVSRTEPRASTDPKHLSFDERRVLEYVSNYPARFITQIYRVLRLSGYKGDRIKERLLALGLIAQDETRQGKGGRLAKAITLTEKGRQTLEGLTLPGKGSNTHKQLQSMIKEQAEVLGWKATVEARIQGTAETVDIGLEKNELRVAIEVSVTTDAENELLNIKKCLSAGYDYVICAISEDNTLQTLKTRKWKNFSVQERRRILYGSPTEVKSLLQKITGEGLVSEKNKAFSHDRNQKQLLNTNEAADYLGISPKTLPSWVSMRKIPHHKVGRLTKFKVEDLDAWLERRRKEEEGKEFL